MPIYLRMSFALNCVYYIIEYETMHISNIRVDLGILELIFVLFHLFLEPTSTIKIASCGFQELSVSYFNFCD